MATTLTVSDVAQFYRRLTAVDSPIDAGRCATCDATMKRGDPVSAYVKSEDADPMRKLADGILVCRSCTYQIMLAPAPNR